MIKRINPQGHNFQSKWKQNGSSSKWHGGSDWQHDDIAPIWCQYYSRYQDDITMGIVIRL